MKRPLQSTVVGIPISREINTEVKWRKLVKALLKFVSDGALLATGLPPVAGSVQAFLDAADAIKITSPPARQIWEVFVLALGETFLELYQDNEIASDIRIHQFKTILTAARGEVDDGNQVAPRDFLRRPTTLPLYRTIRKVVCINRAIIRPLTEESSDTIETRMDISFDRAIYSIWLRRRDLFTSISEALNTPGIEAADRHLEWDNYRKSLVHEFEVKPIFGQEKTRVSLSQIFVPLRAVWKLAADSDAPKSGGSLDEIRHVIQLGPTLKAWCLDGSSSAIRLIGGGPGSGKSTSLKALASELAAGVEVRPLFVPLQHISLDGELRDAVDRYFTSRTDGFFNQGPLTRVSLEDGAPVVIIFDGLDEIARPGEGANEVAGTFVSKLGQMLTSIQGDAKRPIKVIVSGRLPSFQAASKFLSVSAEFKLEVVGFLPVQFDEDKEFVPHRVVESEEGVASLDQRPAWWARYASVLRLPPETPGALSDEKLQDITNEPLLCYLLALSGFAVDNWEEAAENRNRIYEKLVDAVWERGWGDETAVGRRQGPGRSLSIEDFNRLMETFALAAWLEGDTRICSEVGFHRAIGLMRSEGAWNSFKEHNGPDVANLAMNFYLKASDVAARGFEFTHKSFGDYLTARAIGSVAEEAGALATRRPDFALQEWLNSTSGGVLSQEILTFLRDQTRLQATRLGVGHINRLKAEFERIAALAMAEGFPANTAVTWRKAEAQQRNAEGMVWAVLNALFLALPQQTAIEKRRIIVAWPDAQVSLRGVLMRMRVLGHQDDAYLECFAGISAPTANLSGLFIPGVNFREADLRRANFNWTAVHSGSFDGANLEGARFVGSDIDHATFAGANVEDCLFSVNQFRSRSLIRESIGVYDVDALNLVNADPEDLEWLNSEEGAGALLRFRVRDLVSPFRGTTLKEQNVAVEAILDRIDFFSSQVMPGNVSN